MFDSGLEIVTDSHHQVKLPMAIGVCGSGVVVQGRCLVLVSWWCPGVMWCLRSDKRTKMYQLRTQSFRNEFWSAPILDISTAFQRTRCPIITKLYR